MESIGRLHFRQVGGSDEYATEEEPPLKIGLESLKPEDDRLLGKT